ncbi:MAG: hypothetical protein QY306_08965 [Anaerolineales bacterium]|nr:MAG: hypothetical protein QY306_08965 [Anaerolineales bacterium]
MRRIPWDVLLALLAGLAAGLLYSWVFSPVRVVDSAPVALRADFKDQYRSAIAAAFTATGNLERARARLALLGDENSVEALNAQAQRALASGEITQADEIAALASALAQGNAFVAPASPTVNPPPTAESTSPANDADPTSTPEIIPTEVISEASPTQAVVIASTPRPTRTPLPTQGAPFALIGQESICDSNLPDGLLQTLVLNPNRRQLPGIEIRITWDNGEDHFFTGLKPELGNGYADFIMSPDVSYTVQLALGSDVAANLIAPTCDSPNGTFTGGFKLTFQQP